MSSKEYFREYRRRKNPKIQEKEDLAKEGKRRCTKCDIIKPFEDYTTQKAGFMGRKSQCRICDSKYDKEYQSKTNFRAKRDKSPEAKEYRKQYVAENKDWWRKYEREYKNSRRQEDMFFKIKGNLSSRLSKLINKKGQELNTQELIGCNRDIFLQHLESQFTEGMTWENYGLKGWHVDHIMPISSYDLTNEDEVKKACHYTNLQPLWWQDNLEKGDKIRILE
jgi:hypothetical protein